MLAGLPPAHTQDVAGVMEASAALFRDYTFNRHATIYGQVSQEFINLATERMGPPTVFAFAQGLESPGSV